MIYAPTPDDLCNFVQATHNADRIDLSLQDIRETWSKQQQNPFAHGHFLAIMEAHKLSSSVDFPAKESGLLTDIQKSHQALSWLRRMHAMMLEPLINAPQLLSDPNAPQTYHLGSYRMFPTVAVYRETIPPSLIPSVLHNWVKDISKFHHSIKDKVSNPYGFKGDEARDIMMKVREIPLFFSVVQPFSYGNQRLGRLVELTFRFAWNLPMTYPWANSKIQKAFINDLEEYEKNIPSFIERTKGVK